MKKILWYFRKPTGNVEEGNPPVIQPLFKNRTWFSFWSRDVLRRTNGNTSRLRILNMSSQKLKTSEIVPTGLSVGAAIIMPQSHLHPHCWVSSADSLPVYNGHQRKIFISCCLLFWNTFDWITEKKLHFLFLRQLLSSIIAFLLKKYIFFSEAAVSEHQPRSAADAGFDSVGSKTGERLISNSALRRNQSYLPRKEKLRGSRTFTTTRQRWWEENRSNRRVKRWRSPTPSKQLVATRGRKRSPEGISYWADWTIMQCRERPASHN